mgnify:CR=1 FL=1
MPLLVILLYVLMGLLPLLGLLRLIIRWIYARELASEFCRGIAYARQQTADQKRVNGEMT